MLATTNSLKILIADDNKMFARAFARSIKGKDREIHYAYTPDEINKAVQSFSPNVVFLDYDFDGQGLGLELLEGIKKKKPETVVVMITAMGNEQTEMETMKRGGFNYVSKNDPPKIIKSKVERVFDLYRFGEQNRKDKITNNLVGSYHIEEVYRRISKVARLDNRASILIRGESGTGKQLVAENIHLAGKNHDEPFQMFNCCAGSDSLIDENLFGHKKGSFTSADSDNAGLFESAGKGTVFLDEIGSVSIAFQQKLLHVLESKKFKRIGDHKERICEARIIMATNEDLDRLVAEGKFKSDLFYRMTNAVIELRSLNKTPDAIPRLIGHLFNQLCKNYKKSLSLDPELIEVCKNTSWDGNIRELKNALESCVIFLDDKGKVTAEHFKEYFTGLKKSKNKTDGLTLKDYMEKTEIDYIQNAIDTTRNQKGAAAKLGISQANLSAKMKRLNIELRK